MISGDAFHPVFSHDPLCPWLVSGLLGDDQCDLIAEVRANEREKRDLHWERVLYDSQSRHEEKIAATARWCREDERETIAAAIEGAAELHYAPSAVKRAARIARSGGRQ